MRGIKRYRKNRHFPRTPKKSFGTGELSNLLKECYNFHLEEKDNALYNLIIRYKGKVSNRLLIVKDVLQVLGKQQGEQRMKELVYSNNPLLSLIPKSTEFMGCYVPVPLNTQDE